MDLGGGTEDAIHKGDYRFKTTDDQLLWETKRISDIWPQLPSDRQLHIYVTLSASAGMGSPTFSDVAGEYFMRFFARHSYYCCCCHSNLSFLLPQLRISVSRIFCLASGDKLITLAVGTGPKQDLERFQKYCRDAIIHIADPDHPFTVEDVERNGFENDRGARDPKFVQTFWSNMVDKLDVEMDDPADNCVCRRLTQSCLSSPNHLQARHAWVTYTGSSRNITSSSDFRRRGAKRR